MSVNISFRQITLLRANELLVAWEHRMGALHRGRQNALCHALFDGDKAVAVTTASTLIRPRVGSCPWMVRENTLELSRLCADRPGLCRVALRLWREFVWRTTGKAFAVSYQDADLHNGNTYRFDGWERVGYSHSGTDIRSGRPGRDKWVWQWPPKAR